MHYPSLKSAVLLITTFGAATSLSVGRFLPARFQSGSAPVTAIRAIGAGAVFLEADVTKQGEVADVTLLRTTPPFTDFVLGAVRRWSFSPAIQELVPDAEDPPGIVRVAVDSKVFVAAVFRAPTLLNGPTLGTPPSDVAAPSDEIPFPITTVMPSFPSRALFDGTVLVEVHVGIDGRAIATKVLQSAAIFDAPAVDAARRWIFRPARIKGTLAESFAYISFGFRQPITSKGR